MSCCHAGEKRMTTEAEFPLFPLNTVLFPDGLLPLQIFEPRYLDMVSACMREEQGFGICLIREGSEVGNAAQTFDIGCYANIVDWQPGESGLLQITVRGEKRFQLHAIHVDKNQLIQCRAGFLEELPPMELPARFHNLSLLLKQILSELSPGYEIPTHYDDARWVCARLVEFLPLPLPRKQELLETNDLMRKLHFLERVVQGVARH